MKDYREHLDLQKLCFPVAHPSMFRRLGFKWLETVEGLKENCRMDMVVNLTINKKSKSICLYKDEIFVDLKYTKKYDYDVKEIIKNFNIK